MVKRSQAVPAGPTTGNRCTENAEPNWTDSIAVTASAQGGVEVAPRLLVISAAGWAWRS